MTDLEKEIIEALKQIDMENDYNHEIYKKYALAVMEILKEKGLI